MLFLRGLQLWPMQPRPIASEYLPIEEIVIYAQLRARLVNCPWSIDSYKINIKFR